MPLVNRTTPENRRRILGVLPKLVEKYHFNAAGVDYGIWKERLEERTPTLLQSDEPAFEDGVRSLVAELKSSHTAFYHKQPTRFPPQHTIGVTLLKVGAEGTQHWMVLDVYPDGPAAAAGIRAGYLLQAVDGSPCTPDSLVTFAINRRHRIRISDLGGENCTEVDVVVPQARGSKQRPPLIEPKSISCDVIAPSIGRLRILFFPGAFGLRFTKQLDAAIKVLLEAGCDRLLVDLRGNIGGSLGFARLASYFSPDKIPIGHSLTPLRLGRGYQLEELPRVPMPDTRSRLLLTLARFSFQDKSLILLTQGVGSQRFHGKIVVLTNEWTNSAAEIVASFASENGLAMLVGTKTAGNVLGARGFPVGHGYWVRLPVFGWYTSKGHCIDGIGVTPDLTCEIDSARLAAGGDTQLDIAVDAVSKL